MVTEHAAVPFPSHIPAVELDGVTRRFGATLAIDECNLSIGRGETIALLGPNGAGKSTAIGLMLGILEPTSGAVRTLGVGARLAVLSGRVGAMLQGGGLPIGARVGELVDLARALSPSPTPRDLVLQRSGLTSLAGRRADTLSGGETQRVRFAMAIAGDADLLFLDEPTVAMDVESRRAFWDDIRRSAAEGRTVLFATHYLDEADQVADRIIVLAHGRVVADGSPAALRASVAERSVRFTLAATDEPEAGIGALPGVVGVTRHGDDVTLVTHDADATVRALVASAARFRHLEVAAADLDTAFLALTADRPTATAA